MKNYLGIDYGSSKIGLAIADSETRVCLPYKILSELDFWNSLEEILTDKSINEIVLGMPKNMSNLETGQTKIVMNFHEKLKKETDKIIHLEDERITSLFARSIKRNIGMKNLSNDDDSAAAIILDSFLKRLYGA